MVDYQCPHCEAVEQYTVTVVTPGGHSMKCEECGKLFTDGNAGKIRTA